ncbi:MAG: hypothetical protein EPN21_17430 [Methylococcaceae bacterium]|nr:MAG: hypothetical protein EPN21_17430 [Methylococcaceae bacterium]
MFSLVALLLMTLLSVQLMRSNILQMQIAGSAQFQTAALEDAEQTLRDIENELANNCTQCGLDADDPVGLEADVEDKVLLVKNAHLSPATGAEPSITIDVVSTYTTGSDSVVIYAIQVTSAGSRGTTRTLESLYQAVY